MESSGKIGCRTDKIKIIDPNDFMGNDSSSNVSVPLEDLTISVVLRTKRKGRTVLSSEGEVDTTESNGTVEINFIEGSEINGEKVLTTKFTELTTVFDSSFNDETLGISSIDIDFNASMAPMITINFIDVRGSSIFQNEKNISGNNSGNKYATFFQLPYPLFELEVKGYYGSPVTYCLHMLKFTTKFNSKTGNFEIQCQFVGYTYAMLSDMLIGYLRAIEFTEIGGKIYQDKNDLRIEKGGTRIIGLTDLSLNINRINEAISKVGSTSEDSKILGDINTGKDLLIRIKDTLDRLGTNLDIEQGQTNKKDSYSFIVTKNISDKEKFIKEYNEDIGKLILDFNNLSIGHTINSKNFKDIDTKGTDKGFFTSLNKTKLTNDPDTDKSLSQSIGSDTGFTKFKTDINKYLKINYPSLEEDFDVYNITSLYDEINKSETNIEAKGLSSRESLALELKKTVRTELGFEPTVRNIIEIFTFAAEVFMETIYKVSTAAAQKDNTPRIDELKKKFDVNITDMTDLKNEEITADTFHPWPDYREYSEKTSSFVEKYLGSPNVLENPKNVNELVFIDDLLKAFLKSKKAIDESLYALNTSNSTWYPINPIDTNIFTSLEPYERQEMINRIDITTLATIRGMTFLGYTNDSTYLTDAEIISMANIEAEAILRGVKDKKLKASFSLLTSKDFKDVSNKINGTDVKIVGQKGDYTFYRYIYYIEDSELGNKPSPLLIPISEGFTGNWPSNLNELRSKAGMGSVFLANYPGTQYKDSDGKLRLFRRLDNGAKHIQILTTDEYNSGLELYSTDETIEQKSVLVLSKLKDDEITDPKSAGFNVFGGPRGIQDFSEMEWGNKELDASPDSPALPLRFVFFTNAHRAGGLALTRKRTTQINKVKKFDTRGDLNSKVINLEVGKSPYYDYNGEVLHRNLSGNNRKFFKALLDGSSNVTYPYIQVKVEGIEKIESDGGTSYGDVYDGIDDNKFSLFSSLYYYYQDTAVIKLKNKTLFKTKNYARALLFLNSLPWIGNGIGADGEENTINQIMHLFDIRGGFVHAPKLWCAYVGGLLWRLDNGEPEVVDNLIISGGSTKMDPISWKYAKDKTFKAPKKTEYFPNVETFSNSYPEIKASFNDETGDIMRRLPLQAVNEFKRIFFDFVNGTGNGITWDELRLGLEVWDGTSAAFEKFFETNSSLTLEEGNGFFPKRLEPLINKKNYSKISFEFDSRQQARYSLFLELKDGSIAVTKLLDALKEEVVIANMGFQFWKPTRFGNEVNGDGLYQIYVSNFKFNLYFETLAKKLSDNAKSSSPTEEKRADELELFGTANEDVIKLILYKNCKNIYDKWLAGVKDINKIIFQCGINTRNKSDTALGIKYGNTVPSLIDSFRFVSRSFKDIGDELYINPIPINNYLSDDQNRSLYDAVSDVLIDNKFTFEALPTFINFRNDDNVKAIFTPYGNYKQALKEGTCGPSFICVYAGQPSKHLDFKKSQYQNDSFDLNCIDGGGINPNVPKDFTEINQKTETPEGFENPDITFEEFNKDIGGSEDPIAAFIVRYGQQNQNIFSDIELDQSEFTETDESLQIQEDISQKGGENNRTIAGQNLYNVYAVRSYTAKVEMMGNAMIQPMMYFQLDNIPMFHGAYMITRVQHSITPNNMKTSFTGVRTRVAETPLMTAYDLYMSFADSLETGSGGGGGGSTSGSFQPIIVTLLENGVTNGYMELGKPIGSITNKKVDLSGTKFLNSAGSTGFMITEAADAFKKMLTELTTWIDGKVKDGVLKGYKQGDKTIYGQATSFYRTYDGQKDIESNKNTAKAGTSYHGWGIAVDWTWVNKDGKLFVRNYTGQGGSPTSDFDFKKDRILEWLYNNSYRFGFINPKWARNGGNYDEVWHWEYHGKSAACLMENDNVIFGQKIDVTKKYDVITKNPKTLNGTEAVYTGCAYKTIEKGDGVQNALKTEVGCPKISQNIQMKTQSSYRGSITKLLNGTFKCGNNRDCIKSIEGFNQVKGFFTNNVINKKGIIALTQGLLEGFGSSPNRRNPGNIRGGNDFSVYGTWKEGWTRYLDDKLIKWSEGNPVPTKSASYVKCYDSESNEIFKKTGVKYKQNIEYNYSQGQSPTLRQYVNIYAPWGDSNNPTNYCAAIAVTLKDYGYNINVDDKMNTWL